MSDTQDDDLQVAVDHLRQGRMDAAAAQCRQILVARPDNALALQLFGMVALAHGDHAGAIGHLGQAAGLLPGSGRIHLDLADALRSAGRLTEACQRYRRAIDVHSEPADAWHRLGQTLAMLGETGAAIDALRQALQIAPDHIGAHRDLASAGLVSDLDRLTCALAQPDLSSADRINAGLAMATMLDRRGRHDEAFHHLEAANALLGQSAPPFDAAALRAYVDQRIATCTPEWFAQCVGHGNASELPVFIVGMPRSGTTLVEQVLASHPTVSAMGESHLVGAIADALDSGASAWDADACRRHAETYIARLRVIGDGATRVVDKTPDNLFHLGLIAALFPRARVIVCRRDPRDVCLSCYFQSFDQPMPYANDLAACAERVRQTEQLLAHWQAVLPLRLHVVQYEALVADPETESRRLVDFLELDWDPACLDFSRTRRVVRSASLWQVRQPLYAGSVRRWRHYAPFIAPLLDAFGRD